MGNSSSEETSAAASRSMRSTSARRRSSTPHSASKRRLSTACRSACRDARTARKQKHRARVLFGLEAGPGAERIVFDQRRMSIRGQATCASHCRLNTLNYMYLPLYTLDLQ